MRCLHELQVPYSFAHVIKHFIGLLIELDLLSKHKSYSVTASLQGFNFEFEGGTTATQCNKLFLS